MRNLLIYTGVLIFLFTSCITEKKRQKICNTCPSHSEIKDSIVVKTVTVQVNIPGVAGPTVYLENPCQLLCDSLGRLKRVNINLSHNGQNLNINTMGVGLLVNTSTKDTTRTATVPQKEVYHKDKKELVKWMPCVNERTFMDGFCRIWFYITAPLIAIWLAVLYIKRRPP